MLESHFDAHTLTASDRMICRKCALFLASQAVESLTQWNKLIWRQMSGSAKRKKKREARKSTIFQYVGDNVGRVQRVYVWGCASTGALGIPSYLRPETHQNHVTRIGRPARLRFMNDNFIKVRDVACGYGYTVYIGTISKGDQLYGNGINTDSQLGFHEMPKNSGRILDYLIAPAPISLPLARANTAKLHQVACGRAHTIVLTSEGVFGLGNNAYGQCGRPIVPDEIYRHSRQIHKIKNLPNNVTQVVCGQDNSFFLTDTGQVYSCGLGADGQTGHGHYNSEYKPKEVKGDIQGVKIRRLACRADCVLAVSQDGELFGWGNSEYNQLGMITEDTQVNVARHLPVKNCGKIVNAAVGGSICSFVNDQGQVYVWGYGILGKGPNLSSTPSPEMIPQTLFGMYEVDGSNSVIDIQCGMSHFMALTKSGNIYTWGKNSSGCLGLSVTRDQYFPLQVAMPAESYAMACGVDHCVSLAMSYI